MDILDNWGDHVPYHYRNIYKRDWNWNPIDEAPVHDAGDDSVAASKSKGYWPDYEGVDLDRMPDFDNLDSGEEEEEDFDDDYDEDDYDEDDYDDDYDDDIKPSIQNDEL